MKIWLRKFLFPMKMKGKTQEIPCKPFVLSLDLSPQRLKGGNLSYREKHKNKENVDKVMLLSKLNCN